MPEDFGEKTETPTPRRRQEAREQGQIARSQDLSSAALLVGAMVLLKAFGDDVVTALRALMTQALSGQTFAGGAPSAVMDPFRSPLAQVARSLAPLLVGAALLVVAVNLAQVGWALNLKRLQPNLGALNPFKGVGRIFGKGRSPVQAVMGALKRGLNPKAHELGLYICGGRGRHSRNTPQELRAIADRLGLDDEALVRTSRLTARVDNNAIMDGFQIYLHSFVLTADGDWAIVQQGMNEASRTARRYHWHSASVRDFTEEPHAAIVGESGGEIGNLVDRRARPAQEALLAITHEDPDKTLAEARKLVMPAHHDVRPKDLDAKRLGAVLALAHERGLRDFASFLLLEQLGPRTLQSLALIAEVVHGAPSRFDDPARYSFAHGGKDGHPFPVPLKIYDESIAVLRRALDAAKVGHADKLDGMKRLDRFARSIEQRLAPEADVDATIAHERAVSPAYGGRTVMDDRRQKRQKRGQLDLF